MYIYLEYALILYPVASILTSKKKNLMVHLIKCSKRRSGLQFCELRLKSPGTRPTPPHCYPSLFCTCWVTWRGKFYCLSTLSFLKPWLFISFGWNMGNAIIEKRFGVYKRETSTKRWNKESTAQEKENNTPF